MWSSWSSCQLTCLEGRSFETTGRQARSRAVIIQAMENQGSCPQQVFETQPCKGTEETIWKTRITAHFLKTHLRTQSPKNYPSHYTSHNIQNSPQFLQGAKTRCMWEALHGGQRFTEVLHVQKKCESWSTNQVRLFTSIAPINRHYRAFLPEGAKYWEE